MISQKVIRELVVQKLKDSDVLLANQRYPSAVYMAGYALELALKLKICKIFKFAGGFPESKAEFINYKTSSKSQPSLAGTITQIQDIRNHDLNKLLFYSGAEFRIKLNYLTEWNLAVNWTPDMRYKLQKILKKEAVSKVTAVRTLIRNI